MISHELNYFVDIEKRTRVFVNDSTIAMDPNFDLEEHMEKYNLQNSAIHRKLQSKVEALKIMRTELEKYRSERDQFKLMAETLQMRYSAIKSSLNSPEFQATGFGQSSAISLLVNQTREHNLSLCTEVESLRQRIHELQGDIDVLRNRNCDLQTAYNALKAADEAKLKDSHGVSWQEEKSKLIAYMENLKKKNAQLQYDFRSLLDEKEDVVMERDAYKCKMHRLNHELNVMLKGDKSQLKIIDIDALVLENKFQQEKIANLENELELSRQSASKYKTMLDIKRKKGIIKLGTSNNQRVMSHSQVKEMLERGTMEELPLKAATISELKSLCLALLDSANDKNLALSHQKKTNKLLADKISELEQRIHALTGTNEMETAASLSPSQILLNGYNSSTVDMDLSEEIKQLKLANRSELSNSGGVEANCNVEATSSNTSRGALTEEVLSSESIKSIPSCSEVDEANYDTTSSSESASDAEESIDGLEPFMTANCLGSASKKLPDLPPDIAELVRQLSVNLDNSVIVNDDGDDDDNDKNNDAN